MAWSCLYPILYPVSESTSTFPSSFTSFPVHHVCVGNCFVDLHPKQWTQVAGRYSRVQCYSMCTEYKIQVQPQVCTYSLWYCSLPHKVFFVWNGICFCAAFSVGTWPIVGPAVVCSVTSLIPHPPSLSLSQSQSPTPFPIPVVTSKVHPISRSGCLTKEDYGRRQQHQKGN